MDESGIARPGMGSQTPMIIFDQSEPTDIDITTASPTDRILAEELPTEPRNKDELRQPPTEPTSRSISPMASGTGTVRPPLKRDGSAPPPPHQPPPPAPPQQQGIIENPTDSLSLMQLKKIVTEMPRIEPVAYAFNYTDSQGLAEEIDEWFQYNGLDQFMILSAKATFDDKWGGFQSNPELSWIDVDDDMRKAFLIQTREGLNAVELNDRTMSLEIISYLLAGAWGSTAGKKASSSASENEAHGADTEGRTVSLQLQWMSKNATLIQENVGVQQIFNVMQAMFENEDNDVPLELRELVEQVHESLPDYSQAKQTFNIYTTLYFLVEAARDQVDSDRGTSLRDSIAALTPNFLVFLVEIIARQRWDESSHIPQTRVLLLFWKSLLLLFGGSHDLDAAKAALREDNPESQENGYPILTASPLDYHIFRQEITSKYPAYNPPAPLVPLELENNSILPPLANHPLRMNSSAGLLSGVGPAGVGANVSIFNQPVHIATPAPSPPPSPIGPGGKAGKKQNYQTNQNFPFLYPPLDDTSNKIGGKGSSELQDVLVGKKWEGSDVPASIIEAGRLFASRMRMSRAVRQLWKERELFMKFERGWGKEDEKEKIKGRADLNFEIPVDVDEEDIDDPNAGEEEKSKEESKEEPNPFDDPEITDPNIKWRLDAVEEFYKHAMPHLQSVVIVLLKVILTNVTAIVAQANANGLGPGFQAQDNSANGLPKTRSNVSIAPQVNGANGQPEQMAQQDRDPTVEELDAARQREITGKAVSGSLLLLLKWFKLSHILKFEYLTQLLLDSNYLPLVLKLFAHQDVDKAIDHNIDREDLSFFHFCTINSDHAPALPPPPAPPSPLKEDSGSEDEAMPPPILRHRRSPASTSESKQPETSTSAADFTQPRPEVDELGYPTNALPTSPITTYSWRNFFTSINYLRIMQKITASKAHRCLLLVQYKSSTILRKGLKIPQSDLRLYTLKLFKSQVPYCGRKWRQSNMRVITAIYLHCRPDLRDDWLAGSDVDAEVDQALPLEQGLRGLTHWWHLRCYPEVMGKDKGVLEEERDFFAKELEAMGWGMVGLGSEEAGIGDELDGFRPEQTEWGGGVPMEAGY